MWCPGTCSRQLATPAAMMATLSNSWTFNLGMTAMFNIGAREIGAHARPYLIAEMSGNHNQSLDRALAIVDAAAEAGADAVKIQTYTPDTMTLDVDAPGFVIDDP